MVLYEECRDDGQNQKITAILLLISITYSAMAYWRHDAFTLTTERMQLTIDGKLNTRQEMWYDTIERWQRGDIIFGSSDPGDGVESLYLSMLSVYGIVGLSILIVSFIMIFFTLLNIRKQNRSMFWSLGFVSLIGFCFNCIFEALYLGTMSAFNPILYMMIGMSTNDAAMQFIQNNTQGSLQKKYA